MARGRNTNTRQESFDSGSAVLRGTGCDWDCRSLWACSSESGRGLPHSKTLRELRKRMTQPKSWSARSPLAALNLLTL
jgi:hypothetical protein